MFGVVTFILGGAKSLFKLAIDFLRYNWKWVVPLVIVVLAFFYANHLINKARIEGYNNGVAVTEKKYADKIAEEDKKNREFEGLLRDIVEDFGVKAVEQAAARVSKETVYKETLKVTIKDNPVYEQCVADEKAIDQRNAIRRLGYKEVASAPIKGLDE